MEMHIMASFALTMTRGLFGMADAIAPSLAGRIAFELFCRTSDPAKVTPAEQRVLNKASAFMAEARHHRLTVGNSSVSAFDFRPPSGRYTRTVLVIHGWRSRTEHMRHLIDGFRNAGARVISIDLPGHGKSTGRRLNMANAVAAAQAADTWFGPFEGVVGHSFGGAVAINAVMGSVATIPAVRAERLVVIAAPSSMPLVFEDFGRFLNLGPRSQTAIAGIVERIAGRPLSSFVGRDQLETNPVETLVLHAADDKEVSPDHARLLAGAGPHVDLRWVNGLGHRRIIADPSVVVQSVDFVLRDEPAPGGAKSKVMGKAAKKAKG
jgi:pimeloyl-ACP methyl ester carboxylesterase